MRVEDEWAWETWNVIQQACNYSSRIQVTLDLTCPLPSTAALSRWVSEPVSALFVPSPTFLANAKGFPVLSKASQALFRSLLRKTPAVILSEVDHPPPQHTRGGTSAYLQYIRHLERTAPADGPLDYFAKGYTDWLQAPLQPLMDNLESSTYETFERDPIKYALYEEAVFRALRDRERDGHRLTTIWVCGAGRGPLVTRCLQAARRARTRVKIVALEKNPNALVILQEKQALEWGRDVVDVVFGDMRQKDTPQMQDRADIVVSELLGSFGDNELSPECLDGAMRFLKREWQVLAQASAAADTSFLYSERHFDSSCVRELPDADLLGQIARRGARTWEQRRHKRGQEAEIRRDAVRGHVPSGQFPRGKRRPRLVGRHSALLGV